MLSWLEDAENCGRNTDEGGAWLRDRSTDSLRVYDSQCHSGSSLDLSWTYSTSGQVKGPEYVSQLHLRPPALR